MGESRTAFSPARERITLSVAIDSDSIQSNTCLPSASTFDTYVSTAHYTFTTNFVHGFRDS